jgi:DNA-binding MarR family transcriptional regulator
MGHELRSKPGHLVWRAYQLTWQIFAEEVAPLDITPVQEALLLVLSRRSEVDQKTLAELVALDRSTAGNVIDRLEKRGLLTRTQNDVDRRARLVSLTPRGRALSRKLGPIALRAAERLLAPLSPVERSEFTRLVRKVTGLADPLDHIPTPHATTRLIGKQVLCVGLSDAFGQTIIHRLQSDGAQVLELSAPDAQTGPDTGFAERLQAIIGKHDGLEIAVNGGNLQGDLANITSVGAYSRIQTIANARWFTVECLLAHFLDRRHARLINLALFPTTEAADRHPAATAAVNSSIVSLSTQIAEDYRHMGVVSNSISPRLHFEMRSSFEHQRSKVVHVPAMDVGLAVSYLASDEARSVSASNIILG